MANRMKRYCRYHCRTCGSHFSSVGAFDAHKPRNTRDGGCVWPDDLDLVEHLGECRISDPRAPLKRVTLHSVPMDIGIRERLPLR